MFTSEPGELRPIEDVAEDLGIELEDSGSPERRALCPVHGDTAPSLYVNIDEQVWYCHGCGIGGNAVALARHIGGTPEIAYSEGKPSVQVRCQFDFPGGDTVEQRFAAIGRLVGLLPPDLVHAIDQCAVREMDTELSILLDRALVSALVKKNLI